MTWIFLTFVSAIIESISNIFDRFILKHAAKNTTVLLIFWGFFTLIIFCTPAIITKQITISPAAIIGGLINALIYLFAYHCYYEAVKREEVDRIIPVLCLNPLIVLIFATIFFQEVYSPLKYLGIGLIIIGVLIDSLKFTKSSRLNKPALLLMSLAAICFAFKNILGKYLALENYQPLNLIFWIGLNIGIITLIFFIWKRKSFHFQKKSAITDHALAAALSAASSLIYTSAIMIGPAAIVAFLHRIEIFFVFIISEIIYVFKPNLLKTHFNRKDFLQKLLGVILILLGGYLML